MEFQMFVIHLLIFGCAKVLVSAQSVNEELYVYGQLPDVIKNELNVDFSKAEGDQGYEDLSLSEPYCSDSGISDLAYHMIGSRRYNSLICWLWNLKIALPDEKFKKGILSVSIHDMTCSHFQVESIASDYIPSSIDHISPILSIDIFGISATCQGKYKSGLTGGKVEVTVQNAPDSPFEVQTTLTSSSFSSNDINMNIPFQGNITSCETNLEVPREGGIIFHGSVSAKIIGLFSKSIASHVTSALEDEICPQLIPTLDKGLTQIITKSDIVLEKLIDDYNNDTRRESHKKSVTNNETLLEWDADFRILKDMLLGLNSVLSKHLDEGFFLSFLDKFGWLNIHEDDKQCVDCGYFFRGINGLIRYLTGGSGGISYDITKEVGNFAFAVSQLGNVTIDVKSFAIDGLDTLTNLSLKLSKRNSISTQLTSLEGFDLRVHLNLKVEPVDGGIIQGGTLQEEFVIELKVSNILLNGDVKLKVLRDAFKLLTLGDFRTDRHNVFRLSTWRCLLSSVLDIYLTTLLAEMHFNQILVLPIKQTKHATDSDLEKDLDQIMNNALALLINEYDMLVTDTVMSIAGVSLKSALNDLLAKFIRIQTPPDEMCRYKETTNRASTTNSSFFHFNNSSLIRKISTFFQDDLHLGLLNDYLTCIQSFIEIPPHLMSTLENGPTFSIENMNIENLGTIETLDLLDPGDEFHVVSRLESFGCIDNNESERLKSSLSLYLQYPELELQSVVNISLNLDCMKTQIGSQIVLDLEQLQLMSLYDAIESPWCVASPIVKSGLFDFQSKVRSFDFDFNVSWGSGGNGHHFIYSSEDSQVQIGDMLNFIAGTGLYVFQTIANSMNIIVSSVLPEICPREDDSELSVNSTVHKTFEPSFHWYTASIITFFAANLLFCIRSSRGPNQKLLKVASAWRRPQNTQAPQSLLFERKIPTFIRVTIPLLIIATIGVFVASSLSTGASVELKIGLTNIQEPFIIPEIFTFSLGKTVREMYEAKVYTLMTLVLLFSGIWPYVKLLLMMISWVLPKQLLSLNRRESLLMWLDALGKYSLVDSFVLVLMLVSFRFHSDIPGEAAVDAYVIPQFGFYSFLLGTVMSLVIGHALTFLHRFSLLPVRLESMYSLDERVSISSHAFAGKNDVNENIHLRKEFKMLWTFIFLLCAFMLLKGVSEEGFIFEFQGLVGLALGEDRSASYSLLSLGTALPASVENPSSVGIECIRWTYIFFALIMPFSCLLGVVVLFWFPMRLTSQRRMFTLVEIFNAWSGIEVFLISVVASMLELSQFAAFMVGDHCAWVDDVLQQENSCFGVKSSLSPKSTYLIIGVILHSFIIFFSLRLAHQVIEERMERGRFSSVGQKPYDHESLIRLLSDSRMGSIFVSSFHSDTDDMNDESLREILLDEYHVG